VKWRAIMVEVEKYRRKARTEYMDKRTSEWWCDQVHLARAQERERVIEYLRARGYLSLAAGILAGDHEEEP
jgi:hypothetical protein